MSIEVRPLGVLCHMQCRYCYEQPQRDAGNVKRSYDLDSIKVAIEAGGEAFTLFGGEPLLLPVRDLEDLWSWGLERYGRNGIQTSGNLISDEHLRLFRKYKVHVGVSIDGPGELNDIRWQGSLLGTRSATARSVSAIERICAEGIPLSIMTTLHRGNAAGDTLTVLLTWFGSLARLGVRDVQVHLLEVENAAVRSRYALTDDENFAALTRLLALEQDVPQLRIGMFSEIRELLRGNDVRTTCIWYACDPYTTRSVSGIEGHGEPSNCGRVNKEGVNFVKAAVRGFDRSFALYRTPQSDGGCRGCRYFLICKGQCPGTAVGGDWRNRTEHCGVLSRLFDVLEAQLLLKGEVPLSLSAQREPIERRFLEEWSHGRPASVARLLAEVDQRGVNGDDRGTGRVSLRRCGSPDASIGQSCPEAIRRERQESVTPSVTRLCWSHEGARAAWGSRIGEISVAWFHVEWASVILGLRECALFRVPIAECSTTRVAWSSHGLQSLLLPERGSALPSGAACHGEKKASIVVVARSAARLSDFRAAWESADSEQIGVLLGYPECCRRAFRERCVQIRSIDPTWPAAVDSVHRPISEQCVAVRGGLVANTLWRSLGLRAVPHLPCRFDCEETGRLGQELVNCGVQLGYSDEMSWLKEVLSWPVEWSALHGIAELKAPILKVCTNTDFTATKYVIRWIGTVYPKEGADGLVFPYTHKRTPAWSE